MTFKMTKENSSKLAKSQLLTSLPIVIIAAAAGITVGYFKSGGGLIVIYFVGTLVIIMLTTIYLLKLKSLTLSISSIEIILSDTSIIRRQIGYSDIIFNFGDIKKAYINKSGTLVLQGQTSQHILNIPSTIDNIDLLRKEISKHINIEHIDKGSITTIHYLVLILFLILFSLTYLSTNKYVIPAAALIIVGTLIWSFLNIQKSTLIDKNTKYMSYFIILQLLSLCGIAIKYFLEW